MSPLAQSFTLAPLLATAVLLLATGSSWRARRRWVELVGLGAGISLLAFLLSWLPRVIFIAALPSASILTALLVFAGCEWRFAPDYGQTGFTWAIHAAVRPTLVAALGVAAGFWPMLLLRQSPAFSLVCTLTVIIGLIAARTFDQAFTSAILSNPAQDSSDDDGDGGQPRLQPEQILS